MAGGRTRRPSGGTCEQPAQLGERFSSGMLDRLEHLGQLAVDSLRAMRPGRAGLHHHQAHGMRHDVVQLACDDGPLPGDGLPRRRVPVHVGEVEPRGQDVGLRRTTVHDPAERHGEAHEGPGRSSTSVASYPMVRASRIALLTTRASSQGHGWRDHAATPNPTASQANPLPSVPDSEGCRPSRRRARRPQRRRRLLARPWRRPPPRADDRRAAAGRWSEGPAVRPKTMPRSVPAANRTTARHDSIQRRPQCAPAPSSPSRYSPAAPGRGIAHEPSRPRG